MTEHENEMVKSMCARISEEKDPVAFTELVLELNTLFERLETQQAWYVGLVSENNTAN